MPTIVDLIDEAKEKLSVESDNAFAKEIGVTRASISHWRHGRATPDTVTCATLAGLTGRPLAQVIGIVGEARAISREEKAVWRKLAATAAVIGIAILGTQSMGGDHSTAAALLAGLAVPESAAAYTLCEIGDGPGTPLAWDWHAPCYGFGTYGITARRPAMELRPPCWPEGRPCPNACAAERHDRIVRNHTPLYGPWSGYRFAGRDLVAPDGQRLTVARLEGLLWRDSMELRRAGFASRRQAEQRKPVKVVIVDLQDYRQGGVAAA